MQMQRETQCTVRYAGSLLSMTARRGIDPVSVLYLYMLPALLLVGTRDPRESRGAASSTQTVQRPLSIVVDLFGSTRPEGESLDRWPLCPRPCSSWLLLFCSRCCAALPPV